MSSKNKGLPPIDPDPEAETEIINIEKPEFSFSPDVLLGHEWRQQGPFLICRSCDLEHSYGIGMNKQLIGFDEEGRPIIENR